MMKLKDISVSTRLFILQNVVTRVARSKLTDVNDQQYYNFDSLFGDNGELWNGQANQFLNQSTITWWQNFLLIDKTHFNEFFHLTSIQREMLQGECMNDKSSVEYKRKLRYKELRFNNPWTHHKKLNRLLKLYLLESLILDDMYSNAISQDSDIDRRTLRSSYEPGSLFFEEGGGNEYIDAKEIGTERIRVGVTFKDYYNFFYLTVDDRDSLYESLMLY